MSVRLGDFFEDSEVLLEFRGFDALGGTFEGFVVAWRSQTLQPEPIQEAGSRGQMQPRFEFRE